MKNDDKEDKNDTKKDDLVEDNKHVDNDGLGIPIHWIYRNRWRNRTGRFHRKASNILSTRVGMVEVSKNQKNGENR